MKCHLTSFILKRITSIWYAYLFVLCLSKEMNNGVSINTKFPVELKTQLDRGLLYIIIDDISNSLVECKTKCDKLYLFIKVISDKNT